MEATGERISCDDSQKCQREENPSDEQNLLASSSQLAASSPHTQCPSISQYTRQYGASPYGQVYTPLKCFQGNFYHPHSFLHARGMDSVWHYRQAYLRAYNEYVPGTYPYHMSTPYEFHSYLSQPPRSYVQYPDGSASQHASNGPSQRNYKNIYFSARPSSRPPSRSHSRCPSDQGSLDDSSSQNTQSKRSTSSSPSRTVKPKGKKRQWRKSRYIDLDRPGAEYAILQSRNRNLAYRPQH